MQNLTTYIREYPFRQFFEKISRGCICNSFFFRKNFPYVKTFSGTLRRLKRGYYRDIPWCRGGGLLSKKKKNRRFMSTFRIPYFSRENKKCPKKQGKIRQEREQNKNEPPSGYRRLSHHRPILPLTDQPFVLFTHSIDPPSRFPSSLAPGGSLIFSCKKVVS